MSGELTAAAPSLLDVLEEKVNRLDAAATNLQNVFMLPPRPIPAKNGVEIILSSDKLIRLQQLTGRIDYIIDSIDEVAGDIRKM
jgi:hypothetical protein